MADSAPKEAEPERREALDILDVKASQLVDLIKKSKHFIAFTGAGISTSAGIPDFRGPEGAWTLRAQGRQRTGKTTDTLQAIPTKTHMALVELQDRGILKYLVSQNCDGLHRKSGILPEKISELHGNSNREYCKDCGKEYLRGIVPPFHHQTLIITADTNEEQPDFRAVATYEKSIRDHRTGRKCPLCNGTLLDTIINFGEYLPAQPLALARSNARKADLCLALGSSLTVPPACTIPETVGKKKRTKTYPNGGTLVICNLQSTPLDDLSEELRVWATTDDLMDRVMEKLEIPIPRFVLRRRLVVEVEAVGEERYQLTARGVDIDGTPASFLQSVRMQGNRRVARNEPFTIPFRSELAAEAKIMAELEFMGHYGEPVLEIGMEYNGEEKLERMYLLEYDPSTGAWKVSTQDDGTFAGRGGTAGTDEDMEDSLMISAEDAGVPSHIIASSAASEVIDLTSP
ncbi:NAD-dependent deacetylase sirtuin-7 [Colletotrichum paranaense]|uniref:NAD-dependent deacetylase sirtuin-7 n=1 Tax=Colletotrichum paranaense TaxID=1914294 RepID=A0ABQ9SS07_9PEZI|nr:NAD-dependent deacetylase sirtuin-7 [Colletotrichum paranaense]KAK1542299.1 NAD-dependent deacetylase sirtuin-7 [Colletotrichum paranaense]